MTPKEKEKAKELVIKFYSKSDYEGLLVNKYWSNAKFCALIAVDELIYETQFEVPNIRQRYWQKVKEEINNL
jgi:crotonobetainyl-CoA:carnitine CoA-transferase CaiB-like acyl-CoA transferase